MSALSERHDAAVDAFLARTLGLRVARWYPNAGPWVIVDADDLVVAAVPWRGDVGPTLRQAIEAVSAARE